MKKMLSFILALSMIGTMSSAANAYDVPVSSLSTESSNSVMPRYQNVSLVASGIGINSENKATCSSTYSLYSKTKSVVTMTLMKSTDGTSNWTAVESWSKTNTIKTPGGWSQTSTNKLSSSYYYCNFVMVQILDDNDNVIETVSAFSNPTHL